ncbi:stalk domain-containing protein [Anoxynatronum buryatiense]|uniref:Copper amine oxidase N-terminal domain-containing protein n=1 Tax=Anoxynatronum buryatiense TaxID=489973 RepID=A0AA46AK76_9CLOT|nr:stalk domain-containing protein [Anoxynatronum buryatiense]SMP68443.1 Copper amine oxidase N-terminal domain-containing protein [Anoxynatronum buryatiense]
MKMKQRLALVIILALVLSVIAPAGMPVYGDAGGSAAANHTFHINEGNITIASGTGEHAGKIAVTHQSSPSVTAFVYAADNIIITGTTTTNRVVVDGVKANITLRDVDIQINAYIIDAAFGLKNNADVTLTLEGVNNLKRDLYFAGLQVPSGNKITINGTGSLHAIGGDYAAGIGGGWGETGGTIAIAGGTVIATGGSEAAGIGGAWEGEGGTITISGGTVTATGGSDGAGIGGGSERSGGSIKIEGGTVEAAGGYWGAGIGGGKQGEGGTITISSGAVTARGGNSGAGIGGGHVGDGGTITISGGTVTATGGSGGAGTGGGNFGAGGSITISGGVVTTTGGNFGAGTGGGNSGSGGSITISGGEVTTAGGWYSAGVGGGVMGEGGNITINSAAIVKAVSDSIMWPAIHTLSGSIEDTSTAAVLMAHFSAIQNGGTATSIHVKGGLNPYTSFTPTTEYNSIAFTVPPNTIYQLKTGGDYQQHLINPSTDFVVAGFGLTVFDEVENAINLPVPMAPVVQSVTARDRQISISWNSVEGAESYKIYQSTTSGAYTTPIATVTAPVHSFNATGLINGTTYYFVVKAADLIGESVNSNEVKGTPSASNSSGGSGGGGSSNSLNIGKSNPTEGTTGTPYTYSLRATGGSGGHSFEVTSGALPEGLTLSKDGVISGTPTKAGTYQYTISVTDRNGSVSRHSFTLVIGEDDAESDAEDAEESNQETSEGEETPKKKILLTIGKQDITIGNEIHQLDAMPFIDGETNRTLVPLKFISEALGATVTWLPETRQVLITEGDTEILLTIGSKEVLVNGEMILIDTEPRIIPPGRTFVPLRVIGELLGATVVYDEVTREISIER